ncbi:MAG: helix-turn-helix domain-containing protein [Clostridia bacterium]|nr:helix-turn-helix domain-containing protein [Clostridia bacterium]
MEPLFVFDPSETLIKIQLALAYTPRVLENRISVRPYNGLLYVSSGAYTYSFGNQSFTAKAGDIIYLPAECPPYTYFITAEKTAPPHTLQIEFELTDANIRKPRSFSPHPLLLPHTDCASIKCAMDAVISAHNSRKPYSHLLAEGELLRLLFLCNEGKHITGNPNREKTIAPALQFLEAHYTQPISSAKLAALCHVSESQLRRLFKTATGMSPMAYKRNLLHVAAKNLLRIGEFRIGEVAEMLGFSDIYAFSHFFTEVEGRSPREYLRYCLSLNEIVDLGSARKTKQKNRPL